MGYFFLVTSNIDDLLDPIKKKHYSGVWRVAQAVVKRRRKLTTECVILRAPFFGGFLTWLDAERECVSLEILPPSPFLNLVLGHANTSGLNSPRQSTE